MKPVSALQDKISLHLDWNKARVEFVAQFILSLITLRTCSLYRLCVAFQRDASSASSYKRIQRFFRSYTFDPNSIARLLVTLIPLEKESLSLYFGATSTKPVIRSHRNASIWWHVFFKHFLIRKSVTWQLTESLLVITGLAGWQKTRSYFEFVFPRALR